MLAVTFKPGDWAAFGRLAHTWTVVADPDEARLALEWLRDAMHQRAGRGTRLRHVFTFLDDLLNLLAVADMTGPLIETVSPGRAAGIHLLESFDPQNFIDAIGEAQAAG